MEPADRQVLFVIPIGLKMKIPFERTIAIKTEIMNNWDEYCRVSENLEEGDRRDKSHKTRTSPGRNLFCLVKKSNINQVRERKANVEEGWSEILRFVPSVE